MMMTRILNAPSKPNSQRVVLGLLTTVLICGTPGWFRAAAAQPSASPGAAAGVMANRDRVPSLIRNSVWREISQTFGVSRSTLRVVEATQTVWSDSCLGLGGAAEICALVQTPGWRLTVTNGETTWVYRTNANGRVLRLEPQIADAEPDLLPRLTASRVLDAAAQASGLPRNQLTITAAESRTWNGCLGIEDPDRPICTQIALQGWRVIVTAPERVWIYHTNQDGSDVRLNPVSSQSGAGVITPTLIGEATDTLLQELPDNGVMMMITSGGFAGQTQKTVLYDDGSLVYSMVTEDGSPVVLRRLTAAELATFMEDMQAATLSNFTGLSYPAPVGAADYITVTLISRQGVVQYADFSSEQLPSSLSQIIFSWQDIITPARLL